MLENSKYFELTSKIDETIVFEFLQFLENLYEDKFDDNDGRGKYQTVSLQKPKDPGPETTYDYIDNNGKTWKCPPKGWRMVYPKIKALENDNRLVLTGSTLRVKDYWNERESDGKRIDTLWDDLPENTAGTGQLCELFNGESIFTNPKPTELIRRCLQINYKNATIYDRCSRYLCYTKQVFY